MTVQFRIPLAILCFLFLTAASAQEWPVKPITIVITGSSDAIPRVLGEEISGPLGQEIVVVSHPGASGIIAAEYTLGQPADGYTFLNATSALMAANYTFNVKYDILRDFVPISLLGTAPFLLVAHPSLPVHSVAQLIALAKKHPGKLNFAATSPGSSSDLPAELFKTLAHINIVHVSYRSTITALIDVLAGQVPLGMTVGPNAVAQIKAHKLRALAATTAKRSPVLPNVPTFTELGYPQIQLAAWYGLLARTGTPRAIISRLSAEVVKAVHKPEVRRKFLGFAVEAVGSTPHQFRNFMKADLKRWAAAAKAAHMKKRNR